MCAHPHNLSSDLCPLVSAHTSSSFHCLPPFFPIFLHRFLHSSVSRGIPHSPFNKAFKGCCLHCLFVVSVYLLMPIRKWDTEEEQEICRRQTKLWLFKGSCLSCWPWPWVSWRVSMLVYQCNLKQGYVPSVWLVISAYCPSFCTFSEKVVGKTLTLAHVWSCWMEQLKSSSFFTNSIAQPVTREQTRPIAAGSIFLPDDNSYY